MEDTLVGATSGGCGSQAFITTLPFDTSMSALSIFASLEFEVALKCYVG